MSVIRFARTVEVDLAAPLTAQERRRRDRLARPQDRAAYTAAHLLVRVCAGELLDVDPATLRLQQHCPTCGSDDHGRPTLAGHGEVYVSLSHTTGHVAAMAATTPCGIDVQVTAAELVARALTARETKWLSGQSAPLDGFTRLWARKEALIKLGAATDPGRIDVLDPPAAVTFTEWAADGVHGCAAARRAV